MTRLDRIEQQARDVRAWSELPIGSFADLGLGTKDRAVKTLAGDVLALVAAARAAQELRKQVGGYRASDGSHVTKVISAAAFGDLDAALAALEDE